jgi:CRP-like cAMP-binding protein
MQPGRGIVSAEPYSLLRSCDLFSHLDTDDIVRLAAGSRILQLRRGHQVPFAERSTEIGYCAAGRLKVFHTIAPKKDSVIALIEPGEVFGESTLYVDAELTENAQALEAATVVMLASEQLRAMIGRSAELAHKMAVLLARRRSEAELRLGRMLYCSNRERLVGLLLDLATRYGTSTNDGIELGIKLSHQDLASIVGSTRETVTVILGQLQVEKLIASSRRRIYLRDLDRLHASLDGSPDSGNGRRPPRGQRKPQVRPGDDGHPPA